MTDLGVICESLSGSKNSFACLKAYTEVHGANSIKPASFEIFPYSEESFSWLAHTLITTEYVGKRVEKFPSKHVFVSSGTVEYWDISKVEENSVYWSDRSFNFYFPGYLQANLAFWSYFEGDGMYFDENRCECL
jgi:hypothetical protein